VESLVPSLQFRAKNRLRISELKPEVPPLELDLNDLNLETDLRASHLGTSLQTVFQSGWNRLGFPSLPRNWHLEKVSSFSTSIQGSLPVITEDPAAVDGFQSLLRRGMGKGPSIPSTLMFRFNGSWPTQSGSPLFQLEGESSKGIRIGQIAGELEQLDLLGPKLNSLRATSRLSQIQTLDQHGGISVDAVTQLEGGTTQVAASAGPEGLPHPLSFVFRQQGEDLGIRLTRDLPLSSLLPALDPFLKQMGLDLEGIDVKALLREVNAKGSFRGRALSKINGNVHVARGPLLSLDLLKVLPSSQSRMFRRLDMSLSGTSSSTPTGLQVKFSVPDIQENHGTAFVSGSVRDLNLTALDQSGELHHLSVEASGNSEMTFSGETDQSPNIVSTQIRDLGRNLADHARHARVLFGRNPETTSRVPIRALEFRIGLENFPQSAPLLAISPESISLNLRSNVDKLTWKTSEAVPESRFSGLSLLSLKLGTHQGHLVADATTGVNARYSLAGQPERKLLFEFPLLLAAKDQLPLATEGTGELWNSAYYEDFWRTYLGTSSTRQHLQPWHQENLDAGPVSLGDVQFPSKAIRMALGYAGALQLHVPVTGRLLFGGLEGLAQFGLRWQPRGGVLDSRVRMNLSNIQAGGAGLSLAGDRTPLIEDQLDGQVAMGTDGLLLNQDLFQQLDGHWDEIEQLDQLKVQIALQRSRSAMPYPGVVQVSTGFRFQLLNPLLNSIVQNLRLSAPPSTMTYQDMHFNLDVKDGRVLSENPLLSFQGLRLLASDQLDLDANLNLYWGWKRNGSSAEALNSRDLAAFVQRVLNARSAGYSLSRGNPR
jgi:hypothetical protein